MGDMRAVHLLIHKQLVSLFQLCGDPQQFAYPSFIVETLQLLFLQFFLELSLLLIDGFCYLALLLLGILVDYLLHDQLLDLFCLSELEFRHRSFTRAFFLFLFRAPI